jgi:hypothetical protein
MKKLGLSFAILLLLVASVSSFASAEAKHVASFENSVATADGAEVDALVVRVNEIKAMDKSSLSSSEKKQLRSELRIARKSLKAHGQHGHGGTVVISGSLLLIIILLIILL